MVVDRVHRTLRILAGDEKGMLRDVAGSDPVQHMVGGVVLNHLGWAAALGLRTGVFGRQGADDGGRFLRAAMDALGIEQHLVVDGLPTSMAEIFVDDAGGRAIYMAPGATTATTAQHVVGHHAEFIRSAHIVTTEVSQLPLEAACAALTLGREAGATTVLDLDVPPSDAVATLGDESELEALLHLAHVLKPSKIAAREIVGGTTDALEIARALRERYGNRAVVVTDGEAGCAIAADAFDAFVPAQRVKAIDTTGAGDAFLGGLLVALVRGLGWQDAGKLANACGAACAEKLGAFPDDPDAARARVAELYQGEPVALARAPVSAAPVPDNLASESMALLDVALEELTALRDRTTEASFDAALSLIRDGCSNGARVHVTGIGKAEHVAHYSASLFSSIGTPATFLHATEVVHGSAGQVMADDVVIAVSNSGETEEICAAVDAVRNMGARIIVVTGNVDSSLAREAEVVLDAHVDREGGPLGLAPRTSVAAEILILAALSAALERAAGLTRDEYDRRHPAGVLGEPPRDS